MHEDFLSYIMIGLSRGLFPSTDQRRRVVSEEDVLRERLREVQAAKSQVLQSTETVDRAPGTSGSGLWRRHLRRSETDLKRVARPGHPLICGS